MTRPVPGRVGLLLFFLFFLGFVVVVLAWVDLRWGHWVLTPGANSRNSAIAVDYDRELS